MEEEYKVKLKEFEGPMELLLELIEKEKMDITEISLASICDQFLEYSNYFKDIKPEHLANFLVVAAKLILIKSRSLLPFLELTKDEEEGIDEFRKKLQELQKIREGAEMIKKMELKKRIAYERSSGLGKIKVFLPPKNISKEILYEFFINLKNLLPKENILEEKTMERIISFEDKITQIRERLNAGMEEYFHKITDQKSKADMVVAFLAVLELVRNRFLVADQENPFGNIKLKKV